MVFCVAGFRAARQCFGSENEWDTNLCRTDPSFPCPFRAHSGDEQSHALQPLQRMHVEPFVTKANRESTDAEANTSC